MDASEALMLVAGGLFAGGALTFAWSRVPIWRQMPLDVFVPDFAATLRRTDKVQPALLVVSAAAATTFAVRSDGAATLLAALGAAGFALTLVASLAILVPLQRRLIATGAGDAGAVRAMQSRWFRGNLGRSVIATASFAAIAAAAAA